MKLLDDKGDIADLVKYRLDVAKQDLADARLLFEHNSLLSANNRIYYAVFHAINAVHGALEKVSSNRSKIGAQQNRLEHTIANEQNVVENTTSAESRIRDTDMAKEMVEFSKGMILENVGQAMLAQANKSNQDVLALLS